MAYTYQLTGGLTKCGLQEIHFKYKGIVKLTVWKH